VMLQIEVFWVVSFTPKMAAARTSEMLHYTASQPRSLRREAQGTVLSSIADDYSAEQEIPSSVPQIHDRNHKTRHLTHSVLSQFSLVHIFMLYFCKICFNINLPSMQVSEEVCSPGIFHPNFYTYLLPCVPQALPISLSFI